MNYFLRDFLVVIGHHLSQIFGILSNVAIIFFIAVFRHICRQTRNMILMTL